MLWPGHLQRQHGWTHLQYVEGLLACVSPALACLPLPVMRLARHLVILLESLT